MALGPRFSANKFQSVLKSALGVGADGVKGALTHVGAQKSLQQITSVKDAKKILNKLEESGAISDASHAREVMRKAERSAAAIERTRQKDIKQERLAEFDKERAAFTDSVVRQQEHSVSISGDKNTTSHSVSISQSMKKPDGINKSSSPTAGITPVAKPLLDIPFD